MMSSTRPLSKILSRFAAPAARSCHLNSPRPHLAAVAAFPSSDPSLQQKRCMGHTVRIILTRDVTEGRGMYAGEVHDVAAGYARNCLVPGRKAVYATPRNFERCGIVDPKLVATEEVTRTISVDDDDNEDLKAADLLRRYLRNKTLKMTRNVDPNTPNMCFPGHVSAKHLRDKLSKTLKIDLEPHETIHIVSSAPVFGLFDMEEKEVMALLRGDDGSGLGGDSKAETEGDDKAAEGVEDGAPVEEKECTVQIKQLGEYLAKITLADGYLIGLKFEIIKR